MTKLGLTLLTTFTLLALALALAPEPEPVEFPPAPPPAGPPTCLEKAQRAHPHGTPEQQRAYAVACEERIRSDRY